MTSATLPAIRAEGTNSLVEDMKLIRSNIAPINLAEPRTQLAMNNLDANAVATAKLLKKAGLGKIEEVASMFELLNNEEEGFMSFTLWCGLNGIVTRRALHLLTEKGLIGISGACSNIALYDDTTLLYRGDNHLPYEDLVLHNGKSISADNTRVLYVNTLSPYIRNLHSLFRDAELIIGHTTGNRMSEKKAIKDNPALKKVLGYTL